MTRYTTSGSIFILVFLLCMTQPLISQEMWYSGFFVSGGVQYYILPEYMPIKFEPHLGWRASAGYSFKDFQAAFEGGQSSFTGKPFDSTDLLIPL